MKIALTFSIAFFACLTYFYFMSNLFFEFIILSVRIDWDTEVNKIAADSIGVAEVGDLIRHSFEKKTFTLRACDACKKHFLLNVYACTKCDYTMCQRQECRSKTERVVCAPRKASTSAAIVNSTSTQPKSEFELG